MPDEKIENAIPVPEAPKAEVVLKTEPPKTEVLPAKKPDDELGETIDQFFMGMQVAGLRSMKSILTQFKEKADAMITKLDVGASDDPPKDKP